MVLERFAKKGAAIAGSGAGGFAGGFFSSPTFIILGALAVILLFFQGDIKKAFGNLGKIELPSIEFPSFDFEFPSFDFEFPSFDFDFPDVIGGVGESVGGFFEDLQKQFDDFISGFEAPEGTSGGVLPLPPDVEDTGLIPDVATECPCGSTVIQDIQGDVSQVCIPCPDIPEEGDPDFIGPVQPDEPFSLDTFFGPVTPPVEEPFAPPVELPSGFVGEGPSFEGGTIFERDPCFMTLNEIINAGLASSASEAADLRAIACSENVTEESVDFPEDFDFGTSTGSGIFGPPTGEEGIVTGGATLESEEKKAACVSCQLFGLNCPICAGTI